MGNNGAFLAIAALVVIFGIGNTVVTLGSKTTITATVNKAERVTYGSGDSTEHKYLVFTDKEVFENTDEFIFGKFNSSDLYGQLKAGQTYTFTVVGYRIPFFSSYRNIIAIE